MSREEGYVSYIRIPELKPALAELAENNTFFVANLRKILPLNLIHIFTWWFHLIAFGLLLRMK
jgi:hypothetical protein